MDEAAKAARREAGRQYRAANKEAIAAKKKAYYQANKEKENARINQWKRNNPDKIRAYTETYWMKKAGKDTTTCHICKQCETAFEPKRSDAKFCSAKCRVSFNRNKRD